MLMICVMSTLLVLLVEEPIVTCTGHRMYFFASNSTFGAIVAENLLSLRSTSPT